MKPLVVSNSDEAGGAARAALRLTSALRDTGIDCALLPATKQTDHHWVWGNRQFSRDFKARARSAIGRKVAGVTGGAGGGLRSINCLPSALPNMIANSDRDLVNLHWIGGETLSIEAVGKITKPIVWTLHDMWAFAGAEHYTDDGPDARWRTGYPSGAGNRHAGGIDIDRITWRRKARAWKAQHVIAPSNWLARCARESALMADWPVHVVPNALDTARFNVWPKEVARGLLGLPQDVPLLCFGADGGTQDSRKGWDLLSLALQSVAASVPGANAVIFGQSAPAVPLSLPMKPYYTGVLRDDATLALVYNAVDVLVVPSRQDNLPQTGTEAQACGCPVVGFDIGGMPDIVVDGETGLLVRPYDSGQLAGAIVRLLEDVQMRRKMGENASLRAARLWSPHIVARQYASVFDRALAGDFAI
jgi:glycosyltransferase involved in cell wall biosynthesis